MTDSPRWHTRTVRAIDWQLLASSHRLPTLVARVLAARGWAPGPALSAFLAVAGPEGASDPMHLVGVPEAAERLGRAIAAGERITICGDYDVDGITSTALMVGFLRELGANVGFYLPHRTDDGYGLNEAILRQLAAEGSRVLVTVDNGISSHEEIALAGRLGLDVLLTDHHEPGERLPAALAIVNPKLMAQPGPFAPLAGVGVAYTLARAVERLVLGAGDTPCADAQLDLLAIGTIGDLAPLEGENRRLVQRGLRLMAERPRLGLAALARATRVDLTSVGTLADQVAHRLIPRLNAAGRMAHPRLALELLLAEDPAAAEGLAEALGELNRERQRCCEVIEASCYSLLASQGTAGPALVLASADWHPGVMGIIASRLVERYGKPVLLFSREGEHHWRGSGRTVPGINLHAALQEVSGLLVRFGGHHAAVGCTLADDLLDAFTAAFSQAIARQLGSNANAGPPPLEVDAEVPLAELTFQSVSGLECLQPTGARNPAPTLAARHLHVARQGVRGPDGQHLWLEFVEPAAGQRPSRRIEAIGFGMGHMHPVGEQVNAVFVPIAEHWNGRPRLQLRLLALESEPVGVSPG